MPLTLLEADNLRIVEHATLEPGPHLNVIAGPNGSGKTTLLEAIHLLALGRTFRSGRMAQLVRTSADALTVRGCWHTLSGEAVTIGIERTTTARRIHINGQTALTIGALARVMPLQVTGPESCYLFTHSARYRRGMIDWGLFHVEPQFYPLWSRYQRALRQRNAVLLLDDLAGELDAQRRQRLLAALGSLGAQAFITVTEASRMVTRAGQTRVFHVEQGRLRVSESA
ncbi:MAG: AAA family ATPase [Acidiferrobacterales bacterium]